VNVTTDEVIIDDVFIDEIVQNDRKEKNNGCFIGVSAHFHPLHPFQD